ncbi:hypothetical protein ACSFB1_12425, partial [Glaesserella parasuis]|uniref:hypothetical protein n=1 Tax=Glaesserella parasuis TaxID=738 RepID=UPI003F3C6340
MEARIPSGWWPRVQVLSGWWEALHHLDADLAAIDPRYVLRRAARVDNELTYLTVTANEGAAFAERVGRAE